MRHILHSRFQLQLLCALLAAVSVIVLAIGLVANAIHHAESFVLADTNRTLDQAIHELRREYDLRLRGDGTWPKMPPGAQDITLRGISQTVLSSYPGVEGGFWTQAQFLGYSYPTHDGGSVKVDVPPAERSEIEAAISSAMAHGISRRTLRGRHDLVVVSAIASGPAAVWAMKRLPGEAEPAQRKRNIFAAALVAIALLGAAGVLATAIGLRRGVAQMKSGLATLDEAGVPGLRQRYDELGEISAAINQMARTRRKLEEELRREDRVRALGRLVGRIAHEMRNPLNGIRLSLQMLSRRHEDNRLTSGDFQIAIDEVDRMNRLLSDLLAFQQPRPPRIELRRVGPILDECTRLVKPQADRAGVHLTIADRCTPPALVDEQYFRQIMVNLLLNAIEVSAKTVRVSATDADGVVAVQVSDQGPGLTAEQQEHLFEPFYTTKMNGHGLGLAVSRELAQSMGGELRYEEGGPGATFTLRLRGANAS
jgi:signal transduction histidine kinase